MHLLYASDHPVDAYMVKALREAGHVVDAVDQLADGLQMATDGDYQAILLDAAGSVTACAARFADAAVQALLLVIVAPAGEAERSALLAAGADACFVRPVSFIELEARLEALARLVHRTRALREPPPIVMAPAQRAIHINGRMIGLSSREFRLLEHMVAHAGEVIGLDRLQQQVWGDHAEPRPDLVRACVARMRRKLGAAGAGAILRNVAGHGYVLEPRKLSEIAEAASV